MYSYKIITLVAVLFSLLAILLQVLQSPPIHSSLHKWARPGRIVMTQGLPTWIRACQHEPGPANMDDADNIRSVADEESVSDWYIHN